MDDSIGHALEAAADPQPDDKEDSADEQIEEEEDPHVFLPNVLGLVAVVVELGLERNGVVGDVERGGRVIGPFLFLQALSWRVERRRGLLLLLRSVVVVVKRVLEDGVELGLEGERGKVVIVGGG